MGVKESNIIKEIQLKLSKLNWRMFRNNTGTGWQGKSERMKDGSILIREPRFITFGLTKGGGDLIGWKPVVVTQEMVGQTIAQFSSIEVKTENLRLTPEQKNFMQYVNTVGGFGAVFRSVEDAK